MSERPEPPEYEEIPTAVSMPKRRFGFQWVWLLPLVAAIVGGWLAVRAVLADGPQITINFKTAEGLEAGRTRIKYKDVDVGVVKSIRLAKDRAGVLVTAEMSKPAEDLLVEDTRFWVVRARIAAGTVSGIGTLLSGSYIGMDPGKSEESQREFVGLETPPVITTGLVGKQFVLRADDIGSLDVGSFVFYRRLEAGRVIAYELDKDGAGLLVRIFVNEPYDRYVTSNVRFWHASGVDVALDASGLRINTQSLASVVVGGLAFQAPDDAPPQPPATENSTFILHGDRAQAMRRPVTVKERYVLAFHESVRGLGIGAPVDFRGLTVGEVKSVAPHFDRAKRQLSLMVEIDFFPENLFVERARRGELARDGTPTLARLVERGLRAQLRSANLLTGQLFVGLDFVPGAPKVVMDMSKQPPEVPTVPGSTQELQATISSIAKKLDSVPFQEIGMDLRRTLQISSAMIERIDREITPQARETMTEARKAMEEARKALASVERTLTATEPLPAEASDAMREIARAAAAFRVLADYLERHPEALIRGKKDAK
ncbi:MAG TPA: MlaD family protein [Burkholderiales bacterium]|nr:MlaD family protein [Burkholderiales bacterium]